MLPKDMSKFCEGFCWSEYKATIGDRSRLRLNNKIIKTLEKNNVKELWRFPDPTGPRFILCPPQYRNIYIKIAKENLSKTMDLEAALRKYIFSGKPAPIDNHNRITITKACLDEAKLKIGNQVTILGVGLWYEVYRDEK